MPINKIPQTVLTDLKLRYNALPFPNKATSTLDITVTVPIKWTAECENSNNDNVITIIESVEVDYPKTADLVKNLATVKRKLGNLKRDVDDLGSKVRQAALQYLVPEKEIWQFLNS